MTPQILFMAEHKFRIPGQEGFLRVRSAVRIMGHVRLKALSTCMNGLFALWMSSGSKVLAEGSATARFPAK